MGGNSRLKKKGAIFAPHLLSPEKCYTPTFEKKIPSIDFDTASKEWRKNKIPTGGGDFHYVKVSSFAHEYCTGRYIPPSKRRKQNRIEIDL
jgi:hypothetical protein